MKRLTKLEIQRALLAGTKVTWTAAGGKSDHLELSDPSQRRLFAYLLDSDVREPKGLPDSFIAALDSVYAAGSDPAKQSASTGSSAVAGGPWRLQRIETEGFGGLNSCGGPPFLLELDGESLLLQGPNGSGKSSLVGAIQWAIAGDRPRDQSEAKPETRVAVLDVNDDAIGSWPPVACYPDDPAGLGVDPYVRATLTFTDGTGKTAVVQRELKGGVIHETHDPVFQVPEVLVETGLLMPSRLAQIRFEKGQTHLTSAVQALTGLDDLIDVGLLVEGLCHKGREYLSSLAKEMAPHKATFDAALAEVARALQPTDESIPNCEPQDTDDDDGVMGLFGKRLKARATELTKVIEGDLTAGLDLTNSKVQMEIAGAISGAREELAQGLEGLSAWRDLAEIGATVTPDLALTLVQAADSAEAALEQALELDRKAKLDSRLRLKALGAQWHEAHRHEAVKDRPLCDNPLGSTLAGEIEALRTSGDSATRQLADNLNAILAVLEGVLPQSLSRRLPDIEVFVPRERLIDEVRRRFATRERYATNLASFTKLVSEAVAAAPEDGLPDTKARTARDQLTATEKVQSRVEAVRRLVEIAAWFREHEEAWRSWWIAAADPPASPKDETADEPTRRTEARRESFAQHLGRLSDAIGEVEPYNAAAAALDRAWSSGKEAWRYERAQIRRQKIADQLAPLKALGALADAQARLAISDLSGEITEILKRIHLTERLSFRGAKLQRKLGLVVHAGFGENFKIDATLVANTSWLRAVLWAFLFALRKEAVQQLGADRLPLLVLDDPQATFDAEHRHRWGQKIAALQQDATPAQVILVTHDEAFIDLVKIDGVGGREAIITSVGPELGRVGIFEGAALERLWEATNVLNTPKAGRDYMSAVRTFVEGMLQLMLRGEAASVAAVGSGFVLGDCREKLSELNQAQLAPWDKSEFRKLVGQLGKGLPTIKYMEIAHHAAGSHLSMGEANDVETHWRKKLQPALEKAFRLAREHQLLHGGLKALHGGAVNSVLPEGYTEKVRKLPLRLVGSAAALSEGRAADGCVNLTLGAPGETIVLGRHFAFRLASPTLEPVARAGDLLLVQELGEPSSRSLVVARCEDRLLARRFEIASNHSDVAVLTAQAVNPRRIAAPVVVKRATLALHKVIGVLFDHATATIAADGAEVVDCGGESALHRIETSIVGVVEVRGQSAEPIALDKQLLLIGNSVSAEDALTRFEGLPVIAGDGNANRYFKRLRRAGPKSVVLESLEIGGDFPPVMLTHGTGAATDLSEAWPVLGVLFERPS